MAGRWIGRLRTPPRRATQGGGGGRVGLGSFRRPVLVECHLSRTSWTPLHADPESTKKRKRGGLRPQTTHVSASGRLGSQPRQEPEQHDAMPERAPEHRR